MKNILIYDTSTLPKSLTMRNIMNNFNEFGLVVWCSTAQGNFAGKDIDAPPRVIDADSLEETQGLKFIDTADLTQEQINDLKG